MNKVTFIWIALLIALLSTGCSPIVKAEQPVVLDSVVLDESTTLGQTFYPRYDGLEGIEIYLEQLQSGDGEIQLTLHDSTRGADLGQASIPLSIISTNGYYHFPLPIQEESNRKSYYLNLTLIGSGQLAVGTASGDSYLNGALYQNQDPDDQRQMAFSLFYSPLHLALGLIGEISLWIWYLILSGFLFIPPGWALMNLAFPDELHGIIKLILSIGTSLALYPIVLLITYSVGLQLGPLHAWLPSIFSLFLIGWQKRRSLSFKDFRIPKIELRWIDLSFIGIVLAIFAARFWIIRGVEIPLWGDSLQHAMIGQLMLDHGGLFSSWQPYAPYYSLTSHFGFSNFSALFAWLADVNINQATLWMGQLLNGLAIMALYPLAVKISRGNHWVGIGTMLIAGLISPLPSFYVNWGRYAQLAGQAILPVGLWMLWESIDRDQWSLKSEWHRLILAGMVLTGMTLSYYRTPFFYVFFVLILLLFWGLPRWGFKLKHWIPVFVRLVIIGMVGIILFLPWGLQLLGSNLAQAVEAGMTVGTVPSRFAGEIQIFQRALIYLSPPYFLLAALSIVVALLRKNWLVAGLPFWFVFMIAYMFGSIMRLPGANMLQSFAIMIAFYMPLGLIIGWLYGQTITIIEKRASKWPLVIASILTLSIAIWFGWQQRKLLDMHQYALVNPPDQRAMAWIEVHTQPESLFLVQGFEYRRTAAGSDAGWWIPLLAQRDNMLPPQYAQFNEISEPSDYTQRVVDLVSLLEDNPLPSPETLAALCDWGITHIYHGQGQGRVGNNITPLYNPENLKAASDLFTQVYHQDRVYIFEINPTACKGSS